MGCSEGAVPCPERLYFNPARLVTPAGALPSSREGGRNLSLNLVNHSNSARLGGRAASSLTRASVHEAAHTDVHHHPERKKHKQDGRPAVAH
jgi:hypothetical protein